MGALHHGLHTDPSIAPLIVAEMPRLADGLQPVVAFALARHYLEVGSTDALARLIDHPRGDVVAAVLNGLTGEPPDSQIADAVVSLANRYTQHPDPQVRHMAAAALQNQAAWKVDVSSAVPLVVDLLTDEDAEVRIKAAYTVAGFAKARHDMSIALPALAASLADHNLYVTEAAAAALWQMSRARHDLAAVVTPLVAVLESRIDYADARKQAAGALLHHSRKSRDNASTVREAVAGADLDKSRRENSKFLTQLAELA